jgi:hypothetical protein
MLATSRCDRVAAAAVFASSQIAAVATVRHEPVEYGPELCVTATLCAEQISGSGGPVTNTP